VKILAFIEKSWGSLLLLSLTLGLAPFIPEPHIFGKIQWVFGGAVGMQMMDWLDLLMHGSPWLLFIISSALRIRTFVKSR
jgi:uncharacterized membrane protein